MSAELHTWLLSLATLVSLAFAGLILARNPQSPSARLHAVYGALAAWWFFCMAMIAAAPGAEAVQFWARLVHVSLGLLVGVIFHLNVTTAGIAHRYRRRIAVHYALGAGIVTFCLTWPNLLLAPQHYAWGAYPAYSAWGLLPAVALALVFVEVIWLYRHTIRDANRDTAHFYKLIAFHRGNWVAALALVDFVPAFGVGLYPFGFALLTLLNIATAFGSIRYRLIDVTPEFAAGQILTELPDGVLVIDSQGLIRHVNPAGARMLGQPADRLMHARFDACAPAPLLPIADAWSMTPGCHEVSFTVPGGDLGYTVRTSGSILRDQAGARVGNAWLLHDLTEQREAEAEMEKLLGWVRHGQKLETLGVMAGGIAHDFNNLLTAIIGNADIALTRFDGGQHGREQIRAIIQAGERAADLTAQMLTYAGQGRTHETTLDLNSLTREINELINSGLSKKAVLELDFMPDLPLVRADRGQLCQVVMNLVTNASDALEGAVGYITVRTGVLDQTAAQLLGADGSERYVTLEVIDTGSGMTDATRERMFDPFFTTKFSGRGLGLANVVAIVEAHGGRIRVKSAPGAGTHVTVALPASTETTIDTPTTQAAITHRGTGLVLLADDEPGVRGAAAGMLREMGYAVLEAANGREALRQYAARQGEVTTVVLDLTMPELDGRETLAAIRARAPTLPAVLMSGYSENSGPDGGADGNTRFLSKPFRYAELAACLDSFARTPA